MLIFRPVQEGFECPLGKKLALELALHHCWSQALQLPLLDLCKGKDGLQLEEMSKLYVEELTIAGASARGEHEWAKGDGDHVGVGAKKEMEVTV